MRAAAVAILVAALMCVPSAWNAPGSRAGRSDAPVPSQRLQRAAVERLVGAGLVYCGGLRGNAVALTFDDGPGPFTAAALETLRTAGGRATFFDVGRNVVRLPDLVRRELREQMVGDHSWSHPVLPQLGEAGIYAQIARTQRAIARVGGTPVAWLFRPPYGASDERVFRAAAILDMPVVLWSVYTGDTTPISSDQIAANVAASARPGSIILLHEGNNAGVTIAALPRILAALAQQGLRTVTLPELFALDPPSRKQLRTGLYGCGPTVTGVAPLSGHPEGGTAVTITGEQLRPAKAVYFGGQPAASITVVSSTQIIATTPPGSGIVDVRVQTHFGLSPISTADSFIYDR